MFCGETKAGTAPTNDEGFAYFFIPKQLALDQCSNTTIKNYGLVPRNPHRVFQEKRYEMMAMIYLWLKPDPLFSMRLTFTDLDKNKQSGL